MTKPEALSHSVRYALHKQADNDTIDHEFSIFDMGNDTDIILLMNAVSGYRHIPQKVVDALNANEAHASLKQRVEELEAGLRNLVTEATGVWDAYEIGLRQEMGHTNYNCVARRIEEARAVISPPPAVVRCSCGAKPKGSCPDCEEWAKAALSPRGET